MVESSTLEVNMADIRWSSSQVHQPEILEHLWQFSYFKLLHTVETLVDEEIITDATADSLQQVAYDFKVCLQALEELHDELIERDAKKKDIELED
jgi:hypothetical protein